MSGVSCQGWLPYQLIKESIPLNSKCQVMSGWHLLASSPMTSHKAVGTSAWSDTGLPHANGSNQVLELKKIE